MTVVESYADPIWWAKQPAGRGTPVPVSTKKGRKVGGGFSVIRADNSEEYSDGNRVAAATDYVDTISGTGAPVLEGQVGVLGSLLHNFLGNDSVTAAGDLFDHQIDANNSQSFYMTWMSALGITEAIKQQFNDCRIQSLRVEASAANKVMKITPNVISLDPGQIFTSDPVKTDDGNVPLVFTDAVGEFVIGGTIVQGLPSIALVLEEDGAAPFYGDDVRAYDYVPARLRVRIEALSILLDTVGKARLYNEIYGTPSPAVGARPLSTISELTSLVATFKRGRFYRIATTGSPTGGTFTLTYAGQTTAAIAYNATAAQIKTALEALSNLGPGAVTVRGGPLPATPAYAVINRATAIATVTANSASLTGGTTPTATIADQGNNESLKIDLPSIRLTPDTNIAGTPQGGPIEIPFTAAIRPSTPYSARFTVRSPDSVY